MGQPLADDSVYRRTTNFSESDVKLLSGAALRVLLEIDGKRTLAEIGRRLGMQLDEVAKAIKELEKQELAALFEPQVPLELLRRIQGLMVKILGPLGEFVLIEKIEAMGHAVEDFPVRLFPALTDDLCSEIKNPETAHAFRRRMAELMQALNPSAA
ncbi:MAG: helix-turn-helix domain-containing protein [Desulfobacterales bacterium]